MSYLCRDWTPTVDDPCVECHMPAGKAVRIELEIAKYRPSASPTLILQAASWALLGIDERPLWDLTESAEDFDCLVLQPDPRHRYFRSPTARHRPLCRIDPRGSARATITFDPSVGTLNEGRIWTTHDRPWLLRIGCPKGYTGMVTPLGSLITCRWEILNPDKESPHG